MLTVSNGGLMEKNLVLLIFLMLASCGQQPSNSSDGLTLGQAAAKVQCAKDTDCKGDRICDSGQCMDPKANALTGGSIQNTEANIEAPQDKDRSTTVDALIEADLVNALRQKPGAMERIGDSGRAIRGYINSGYVTKKPTERSDYSDYRILQKPAYFMGHALVAIEEEYFQKWIGCCVSPGMAVTLKITGTDADLKAFAAKNGCSIDMDSEEFTNVPLQLLPKQPKGTYATLSCKERDFKE
jgi:hypothetical protein